MHEGTFTALVQISSCSLGDFIKEGEIYEDLSDFPVLKKYMEDQLEDYNMEPGVIPMSLVLFRDAIEHGLSS